MKKVYKLLEAQLRTFFVSDNKRFIIYLTPLIIILSVTFIVANLETITVIPSNKKIFKIKVENEDIPDVELESQIYDYISPGVSAKKVIKNELCYIKIGEFSSIKEASTVFGSVFAPQLNSRNAGYSVEKIGSGFYIRVGPIERKELKNTCQLLFGDNVCNSVCF